MNKFRGEIFKLYRYSDRCCKIISTRKMILCPVLIVRLLSLFVLNRKVFPLFNDRVKKNGLCNQILLIDRAIIENHIRIHSLDTIKSNEKNILFIDAADRLVYRLSFHAGMDLIKKNYESLKKVKAINAPKPISLHVEDDFAISVESLVDGTVIPIHEFDYDALFEKLVPRLAGLYRATRIDRDGINWRSLLRNPNTDRSFAELEQKTAFNDSDGAVSLALIHGDLTYRNILAGNDGYSFIDFDRSEIGFPEHDLFLLYYDYLFHRSEIIRYETLMTIIIDDLQKTRKFVEIADRFYSQVPEFSVNRGNIENIMRLFLLRTLNNIFQDHAMNPDIDMGFIASINTTIGVTL